MNFKPYLDKKNGKMDAQVDRRLESMNAVGCVLPSVAATRMVVVDIKGPGSKTQLGRDALILYDDGVITEHSVGISAVIREEDEVGNTAQIKEARLWEYSPVTWGANPLTPTVDVKSALGREASATIPTPLEVQIKNAGRALHTSNISDELGRKIESWLKLAKGEATPEELGPDAPKLDSSLEELVLLSQSYLVNLTI
jgi:hypothetical protein